MNTLPSNRPLAAFVLLTFCVGVGCSNVRTVGIGYISPDVAESLVGARVKFHGDDWVATRTVESVDYPYVVCKSRQRATMCKPEGGLGMFRTYIDLRQVYKVEIVEPSAEKTFLLIPVILVGLFVLVAALTWGTEAR